MIDPLKHTIETFEKTKKLADKAIVQVSEGNLFATLDEDSNSIAIIMQHMTGNMHSRWTDFLTTDGEKPNRNRDSEFIIEDRDTKERILEFWNAGWQCVFNALNSLTPSDLGSTIAIRNEPHLVIEAINRQLAHYAYHIGQIVLLARHFTGENWQTLSIPKGKSEEYNRKMFGK